MIPSDQEDRIKSIKRVFWLAGLLRDDTIIEFYEIREGSR
jgi:hypothetical protein